MGKKGVGVGERGEAGGFAWLAVVAAYSPHSLDVISHTEKTRL